LSSMIIEDKGKKYRGKEKSGRLKKGKKKENRRRFRSGRKEGRRFEKSERTHLASPRKEKKKAGEQCREKRKEATVCRKSPQKEKKNCSRPSPEKEKENQRGKERGDPCALGDPVNAEGEIVLRSGELTTAEGRRRVGPETGKSHMPSPQGEGKTPDVSDYFGEKRNGNFAGEIREKKPSKRNSLS